ncbi:MAG: mannitol dehydrogenase family protein, partial [Ruthenibacterium sp.]
LQQRLLNAGLAEKGIVAADTFDYDIIDKIYAPFDNLTMNVTLNPDASTQYEIIASVAEALKADSSDAAQMARFAEIFTDAGLQMASFTITEKGYALYRADGSLLPVVEADMTEGPQCARHAMSMVAALLYKRYLAGQYPLAVVSMDNCSHNGEKLQTSVLTVAKAWCKNGFVEDGFLAYLADETKIAFPWSMIDKITPRPAPVVQDALAAAGIEDMAPIITGKNTFIAPFVNAERPQYLVVEDQFPNGRPAFEKAGVYMTSRDVVNKTERMKVTTCLNPLHTAMSVYGCMLGYTLICDEMKDAELVALIKRLGYVEGLPVVTDPGILSPKAFIDEVVTERLPNPFMPDAPQRIATDTSQKVGIRFGETIKSYVSAGRDLNTLVALPLALAGWLRYLLAVDDRGEAMEVSSDPMKADLQAQLAGIQWNDPASYHGQLRGILANAVIFGSDLTQTVLADKIEAMFTEELAGIGAVRATLKKYLA